ncbi:MAG: DNA repair protein RecO [Clostridiales bacterium]|nr:DNA repair protein RecO [Clostridiales bacterium]
MSDKLKLTGMVLKSAPAGEYDRRIVLLTREMGKVTAFVRGARRPKSALQAATNLFSFGTFEAYEGRDAFTVVKADISNYFGELYTDPERMYYGCYLLELADYFVQPYAADHEQLKLLYQSVRALCSEIFDPRLVRRIYELKTLTINGVAPNVFSCTKCGKSEQLVTFSMRDHGLHCVNCAVSADIALSDAAIYTLQYIIGSSIEKLYTFKLTDEVLGQVSRTVGDYLKPYVDRELKTLAFLPE